MLGHTPPGSDRVGWRERRERSVFECMNTAYGGPVWIVRRPLLIDLACPTHGHSGDLSTFEPLARITELLAP